MGIITLHAYNKKTSLKNLHKQQHRLPYFIRSKTGTYPMLTKQNKTRKSRQKEVYQLKCFCDNNKSYNCQTRVCIRTRIKQNKSDICSKKPESTISGISKHARQCNHGQLNWDEPEIIATFSQKNINIKKNLLVRESLEIKNIRQ